MAGQTDKWRVLAVALIAAWVPAAGLTQSLDDPMRPPAAESQAAIAAGAPAAGQLQAVIVSPQRKIAVIDGAVVPLGADVRGGKLAGVSDSVAIVRKNGERDVLLMHPNIDKRPARPDSQP